MIPFAACGIENKADSRNVVVINLLTSCSGQNAMYDYSNFVLCRPPVELFDIFGVSFQLSC